MEVMDGSRPGLPAHVVAAHLASLRQRGHTPGAIYARRRALARMTAALPVPLLDATPADLAAWRAGLDGHVQHGPLLRLPRPRVLPLGRRRGPV